MKTETKLHSEYSCSKAKTYIECPASIQLCREAPKLPDSDASKEGTDTHTCLEAYNLRHENKKSFAIVTKELLKAGHPKPRIERAQKAHIKIMAIKDKYPGAKFYAETKVDTSFFLVPNSFGTVDAAVAEVFGELTVIDYKNGVMPVDPKENYQGICYGLGIAKEHDFNFEKVNITILQPNSRVAYRTESTWTLSMKKLRTYIPFFEEVVRKTKAKNPETHRGDWCYFCPAKNFNCPEHKEKKLDRARSVFEGLDDDLIEESMW